MSNEEPKASLGPQERPTHPSEGESRVGAERWEAPPAPPAVEPDGAATPAAPPTSEARSRGRLLVLGATLAVLTLAGLSIAKSLREADWWPALKQQAEFKLAAAGLVRGEPAAAAAAPSTVEAGDPSERCELRIFADQPGGETIVALTAPGRMTEFRQGVVGNHSRLARELVRQALLLCLREELNVSVRDLAIGDPSPQGSAVVVDVAVLCPPNKTAVRLSRSLGKGARREVLFERTLRDSEKLNDHLPLLRHAEEATRDGLPAVFAKLGVKGKPRPKPGDGAAPAGVEDQLLKMSFVPQFAAVRRLHQTIRAEGSSPWRLHALARGYANLGVLTEHQWDAAAQAYKARGLLYAQRDVAARPGAPRGRWTRAYAAALAGTHVVALNDLDAARRFADKMAEAERPAPPPWAELIQAYCFNNVKAFAKARTDALAELEALLYLLTVEHPSETDLALNAARGVIELAPECFRAHDALCAVGGVANLHRATLGAPRVLDEAVPRRIAALPGAPAVVRAAVEGGPDEVRLTKALDEAAAAAPPRETAEPSWGALAQMVRETRFVCTFRRLYFMARWWNVPTGDYWSEVEPLVARHRFRPFLETYVDRNDSDPELLAWIATLDTTDLGLNASTMTLDLPKVKQPGGGTRELYAISATLCDWTAHDIAAALRLYQSTQPVDYARKLLSVSPNSAYAMGVLVESAWEEAEKKLDGWRAKVGDHPSLIGPLARQYEAMGRLVESEALLKRYIELSPDLWAYQTLAKRALALGHEQEWKTILDGYLAKVEDHGLDHAKVRVEIANGLMAKGEFDEARPYAEAAARTWAGWAMQVAQTCAEGQEDWKGAEQWARARALRYPSSSLYVWLDFCERTGQGNFEQARDFTLAGLERMYGERDGDGGVVIALACLRMMRGEPRQAFEPLQRLMAATAKENGEEGAQNQLDYAVVVNLAAAGLAGDQKRFDAAAAEYVDRRAAAAPLFTGVLTKIREAIAKKDPTALDRTEVDALIAQYPKSERVTPAVVVASYLAGCDQPDLARPYWEQAADKSQDVFWLRVLAAAKLRQLQP